MIESMLPAFLGALVPVVGGAVYVVRLEGRIKSLEKVREEDCMRLVRIETKLDLLSAALNRLIGHGGWLPNGAKGSRCSNSSPRWHVRQRPA